MRVLVCGGRDYKNYGLVAQTLDEIDNEHVISLIIEGGATGADLLAFRWAVRSIVKCEKFSADWQKHGSAAGPIRNQRMIDEGRPDLVVAFPGGRGTTDMIRRARSAGIKVVEVKG